MAETAAIQADRAQQGMQAEAVETIDQDDGGAVRRRGEIARSGRRRQLGRLHDGVQARKLLPHAVVVAAYGKRHRHQRRGHEQRHPAAAVKLQHHEGHQDETGETETHGVDGQPPPPRGFLVPHQPPVAHHAELREAERDKDVDAVENDEQAHCAACHHEHQQRGAAHDQHAVERDEAVAQRGEARGHPAVERHVGQHARSIQKARLRGDKQDGCRTDERDFHEPAAEPHRPAGGEPLEQHRIEGLAFGWMDAEQQVGHHQSGDHAAERDGHEQHGAPARPHARFAQDGQPVAHGFNARVRARTHAVGAQQQRDDPEHADLR